MIRGRARFILAGSNNPLLRWIDGAWNVFIGNLQETYAQAGNGNWSNALLNFSPLGVAAINPKNQVVAVDSLPTSLSALTNTAIILVEMGQSPAVGAPPGVAEDDTVTDPTRSWITQIAPHGQAFTINGGSIPNPDGPGSNANRTLIPASQYVSLVPLVEGIQFGRTPGKETYRETAMTSAVLRIASALPASSICVGWCPGNGSTGFTGIWGQTNQITAATYNAGTGLATYTTFAQHEFLPGRTYTLPALTPSGYGGSHLINSIIAVAGNYTQFTVAMSNPGGSFSGSVDFDDVAIPTQSNFDITTYVAAHLVGGRSVELWYIVHDHEADSTVTQFSIYSQRQTYRRTKINALAAIVGAPTPLMCVIPTQKPRSDWHDSTVYVRELSVMGGGAAEMFREGLDANAVTLSPIAAATTNGMPEVHRAGVDGYQDWGEHAALLLMDKRVGNDTTPLLLADSALTTAGGPSMVAGSTTVTLPLNQTGAINDGYSWINDPDPTGGHGIQIFTNALTAGQNSDPFLTTSGRTANPVSSISIAGSTITVTLASAGGVTNRQVGVGFKNAINYTPMANNQITAATYNAGTGLATYTTTGSHGINVGEAAPVFGNNPSSWDNFSITAIAKAGTTGNTLVIPLPSAPTAFVSGGSIARNGADGLGPIEGLRNTIRKSTARGTSIYTRKPFYDLLMPDLRDIKVYSQFPRLAAAIADLGFTADWKVVLDWRDSNTTDGSAQLLTNLGSTTTTDNYYRGTGSGGDARDPTFNGSANSLDAYYSYDGGDIMSPVSASKVLMAGSHKAGGAVSWCVAFYFPAAASGNPQTLFGTTTRTVTGPGIRGAIASDKTQMIVTDDSAATVYVLTGASALTQNAWHIWCGSIADGNAGSYSLSTMDGLITDNTIYGQGALADPSTSDMLSAGVYLGQDGSTGTARLQNGFRTKEYLLNDVFVPRERMLPIFWTLVRNIKEGL